MLVSIDHLAMDCGPILINTYYAVNEEYAS